MYPSPPLAHGSTDVISPRAHGFFNLAAFSIVLGWAARRSKRAGAIILATALGEGNISGQPEHAA